MLDKLKQVMHEATDLVKEQSSKIGSGAREKTMEIIEDWLKIFPKLQAYGLEIKSFSLGVAISPSLEVDMLGQHTDFSEERIEEILKENPTNTALRTVLTTIRTTYKLHQRTDAALIDPLIVKIRVRISPEVKVFIGEPLIQ